MAKKAATKVEVPPAVQVDVSAPKLTVGLLSRLYYVNSQRKRLEREANQLKTEENMLRDAAFAWLESRSLNTVKKFGYRLSQKLSRVVVPWKEAFIAQVGVDAANKLTESSPKCVTLEITEEA